MIVFTNYNLSNGHADDACQDSGDVNESSLDADASGYEVRDRLPQNHVYAYDVDREHGCVDAIHHHGDVHADVVQRYENIYLFP